MCSIVKHKQLIVCTLIFTMHETKTYCFLLLFLTSCSLFQCVLLKGTDKIQNNLVQQKV